MRRRSVLQRRVRSARRGILQRHSHSTRHSSLQRRSSLQRHSRISLQRSHIQHGSLQRSRSARRNRSASPSDRRRIQRSRSARRNLSRRRRSLTTFRPRERPSSRSHSRTPYSSARLSDLSPMLGKTQAFFMKPLKPPCREDPHVTLRFFAMSVVVSVHAAAGATSAASAALCCFSQKSR